MKDVFPDLNFKIGGPAVVQNSFPFLKKFIKHCRQEKNYVAGEVGTKIDFLSFHLKGGMLYFQTPNIRKIERMLISHVKKIRKYVGREIEIHITELDPVVGCDKGISDSNKLNWRNTNYYAAYTGYIASMLQRLREQLQVDLNFVFSDNFHIGDDAKQIFGGARHLTTAFFMTTDWKQNLSTNHAIAKPVVKAYQILARMEGRVIKITSRTENRFETISTLVTENSQGNVVKILVSNFNPRINNSKNRAIHLSLTNLPSNWEDVSVIRYIVDKSKNNVHTDWIKMGSPKHISKEEYELLQKQEPLLEFDTKKAGIEDGKLELEIPCTPHSLNYLEITNWELKNEKGKRKI